MIGNEKIDMDESLWRYFKVNRFLELLNSNKIYFASARQFEDPFEGAVAVFLRVPLPNLETPFLN